MNCEFLVDHGDTLQNFKVFPQLLLPVQVLPGGNHYSLFFQSNSMDIEV